MKHPIAQTHNGAQVYIDLVKSQAAMHVSQKPHLLNLVKELVQQIKATTPEVNLEQDMGRVLGYSTVVETGDKDTILYAQLLHDDVYTRFTKNGKHAATQHLTVLLRRDDNGEYELYDTWIGHIAPPRPGSKNETAESKSFWENHAVVFDGQPLQQRTITKVCPYEEK